MVRELKQTGETIHVVHDPDGNRIAEYDYDSTTGTSTLIRQYVWMEGRPVAVVEGGQIYYIRTDHIGRPVFATNDLGVKVWEAAYLPFGGVHTATGSIDLRFPGQWFQAESGLHQNWMRDYDPTTGRYIQADPLGLVDGASVYGYALQNPGRYTDPRGENHLTSNGQAKCDVWRVTGIWGGAPNWCNEPKPAMCISTNNFLPAPPQLTAPDDVICEQCSTSAPKGVIVNTPTGPIETFTNQPPPPPLPPQPPEDHWLLRLLLLLTGGYDL